MYITVTIFHDAAESSEDAWTLAILKDLPIREEPTQTSGSRWFYLTGNVEAKGLLDVIGKISK